MLDKYGLCCVRATHRSTYASHDETSGGVWDTTPSHDGNNRPYRGSGRGYGPNERRDVYGRGGGCGRGRGQHKGSSSTLRGGAPVPLPSLGHREYTEELLGALVPLLKHHVDYPITLDGPEYESFSSNECTLLLFRIAAERRNKFWLGDKFDLAD